MKWAPGKAWRRLCPPGTATTIAPAATAAAHPVRVFKDQHLFWWYSGTTCRQLIDLRMGLSLTDISGCQDEPNLIQEPDPGKDVVSKLWPAAGGNPAGATRFLHVLDEIGGSWHRL